MSSSNAESLSRRRKRALLLAASPAAVALAGWATYVWAAGLPYPNYHFPASGAPAVHWSNVHLDGNYSSAGTTGSVTQTAPRAYADWNDFSVGPGSTFTVNGQQQDWILVNRVVQGNDFGPTTSQIDGTINATGQVWIINPAGIVVSNTGVFNVGGLLLSTATDFSRNKFLAGGLTWDFGRATASIQMQGQINASGGVVALLAPQITVGGITDSSDLGYVNETSRGRAQFVAIAAQDVSLTFSETGDLLYQFDGATIQRGVAPGGRLQTGGVDLNPSSAISLGRIFVAAAGTTAPSHIVAYGGLTATQARLDGQDIVLMTTDLAPAGSPQVVASGGKQPGKVNEGATTTLGGDITLAPSQINSVDGVTDPAAAAHASLMVRAAGQINLGFATNPVGDIDLKANGDIAPLPDYVTSLAASDVALQAGGSISVDYISALDDIVVRSGGAFTSVDVAAGLPVLDQNPSALTSSNSYEAGERLIARTEPVTLAGHGFNLTGHDVDVIAGSINIGSAEAYDVVPQEGFGARQASLSPQSATASPGASATPSKYSDIRLVTQGPGPGADITANYLTADHDVLVDAYGNASLVTASGVDVAARARTGNLTLSSATASDDVVLRAAGAVNVRGALTAGGADSAAPEQTGDLLAADDPLNAYSAAGPGQPGGFTFGVTGSDVEVKAASINLGGPVSAAGGGGDVRLQATTGAIGMHNATAGGDILIDADQNVASGVLTASGDVGVRSFAGSVSLPSASAGDDLVLRSAGPFSISGALTSGGGADSSAPDQAGDLLTAVDPISAFGPLGPGQAGGTALQLTGTNVDIKSASSISLPAAITASGDGSVRLQTPGAVTLTNVTAGGDVLIDAGQDVSTGTLSAGRDVGVRSFTGAVSLASASAGDDLVLRGDQVSVSSALNAGGSDSAAADQAGDLLASADPIRAYSASGPAQAGGPSYAVTGSDIDIKATGPITVGGAVTASGPGGDIRLDSLTGLVSVTDLLQQGGSGGEQVLVGGTGFNFRQITAPSADLLLVAHAGAGNLTLGGAGGGAGFVFDNGDVSRTTTRSLNGFLDAPAASGAGVTVQDIALNSTLRSIRVYAGSGARVDVTGQVTDPVGGGSFAVGAAATDLQPATFTIGSAAVPVSASWTPGVIRVSGGIGATGPAFGRVTLAGSSIYIAPRQDTALGSDFETAAATQTPESMPAYAGPATVQIRTGTLVLMASNQILERNLQPTTTFTNGLGLEIGALRINRLNAGGPTPSRISLFGRIDGTLSGAPPTASTKFIGGVPAAFLIQYAPRPGSSVAYYPGPLTAVNYRFNTCEFGGQDCVPTLNPSSSEFNPLPGRPDGYFPPLPPVAGSSEVGDISDPFAPVQDEPVTNAGGEVDWPAPANRGSQP